MVENIIDSFEKNMETVMDNLNKAKRTLEDLDGRD